MASKEVPRSGEIEHSVARENLATNPGEETSGVVAQMIKDKSGPPIHNSVPGLSGMGKRRIPLSSDEVEVNSVV